MCVLYTVGTLTGCPVVMYALDKLVSFSSVHDDDEEDSKEVLCMTERSCGCRKCRHV